MSVRMGCLSGWDACQDRMFAGMGCLSGWDVCKDGMFARMGIGQR